MSKPLRLLQKRIFKRIKKKALEKEGQHRKDFQEYLLAHEKLAKRKFEKSTSAQLISRVKKSDICFISDFHTFEQNCRNLTRLLRGIKKSDRKRKIIIGLEVVQFEHQEYLDSYLNRDITELEFIESINYAESWRFPWIHYHEIFAWAQAHQVELLALNSGGSLEERDHKACEIIANRYQQDPDALYIVFFGELHLTQKKMPGLIRKKLGLKKTDLVTIYQNLDDVYWKMEFIKTRNKVIKFNDSEYSLQTSPPWIKYESMIYWYEHLHDDPDFDIHEYIINTGMKAFGSNHYENFLLLCQEASDVLQITDDLKGKSLDDYNIYDYQKLEYVDNLIDKKVHKRLQTLDHYLLENNEIFKLSGLKAYFIPSYSANRLTYLAGLHIFYSLAEANDVEMDDMMTKSNITSRYLVLFSLSLWAYLTSKVFNPHRKCDLYKDLKKRDESESVMKAVFKIIDTKSPLEKHLKGMQLKSAYKVARITGHFFGEYFFNKFKNAHNGEHETLTNLILPQNILSEDGYKILKASLFPNKQYKMHQKKLF